MKKARVLVAEFKHETNWFSPNKAGMKEYEKRLLKDYDEVIPYFKGTRTEIGGMIEASDDEGFEIIPIMAASATPSGLTTKEVFDFVKNKIVQAINDTKDVDGIEIIVAERRMQPYDAEIFRRVGIEPTEKRIIVLKSAIHYKASFGPMAKKFLDVDTPEYHSFNFKSLNFKIWHAQFTL